MDAAEDASNPNVPCQQTEFLNEGYILMRLHIDLALSSSSSCRLGANGFDASSAVSVSSTHFSVIPPLCRLGAFGFDASSAASVTFASALSNCTLGTIWDTASLPQAFVDSNCRDGCLGSLLARKIVISLKRAFELTILEHSQFASPQSMCIKAVLSLFAFAFAWGGRR